MMRNSLTLFICKRWLVFLLFALFFVLDSYAQSSAYEVVENHKQWMHENYPKAASLNASQRLREAAFAIFDELREPEAMALLHDVGKDLPAVEEYAALEEADDGGHSLHPAIKALDALCRYADKTLGKADATTGWCKYLWLISLSNVQDVYPLMNEAIAEQRKIADKSTDRENKALVCLLRFLRYESSSNECLMGSPDLYDDVLQAEQEVIRLYPMSETLVSRTRAWVYMILGKTKCTFTAALEAEVATRKFGLLPDSFYAVNTYTGVWHNSEHYFSMAGDIYLKMYNPGHPAVMTLEECWENARESYTTTGESNQERAKFIYDYYLRYFGRDHCSTLFARLNYWNILTLLGKEVKDAYMWHALMEKVSNLLGDKNPNYTSFLLRLGWVVAVNAPNDFAEMSEVFDKNVIDNYGEISMKSAYVSYLFYSSLKDLMPDVYNEKASRPMEYYSQHHDKSIVSIEFGRRLAIDTYVVMGDSKSGAKIQKLLTEDVEKRYGAQSFVYLKEREKELSMLAPYDATGALAQYPSLIKQMKSAGVEHTEALADYANLEAKFSKFDVAAKLYQQAYDESESDGASHQRANYLLNKLNLLPQLNVSENEQERIYNLAMQILDANTDTLTWIPLNYELAADWLDSKGRFTEEMQMVNRGLEVCDMQNSGFSSQYVNLTTRRYNIYMYRLNDMSTAYKLIDQDLDNIESLQNNYYDTNMLYYLWSVYDILPKNGDDIFKWYKYLNLISKVTSNLASQNGGDMIFVSTYVVKMIHEVVDFAMRNRNFMENVDSTSLSDEQRKAWNASMSNYKTFLGQLNEMNSLLDTFASNIPNYDNQVCYFMLLDAMAKYFTFLNPNREMARKYLDLHMQKSKGKYQSEYFNACCNMLNFYIQEREYAAAKNLCEQELMPVIINRPLTERLGLIGSMADICVNMHDYDGMLAYAREYYKVEKSLLDNNFPMFTEQEQDAFMNQYSDPAGWLTGCMAVVGDKQKIAAEVYDAVLYRTGMQLRSQQATRKAILNSGDKEIMALVDSLNTLQSQMKSVNPDMTTNSQDELNRKYVEIADYQKRINLLERNIIEQSAPYRSKVPLDVTWKQVRERLRPDEAAIEFVYAHPYWMALVLTPGCASPKAVALVDADVLQQKMLSLGTNTPASLARKLYDNEDVDLYGMLWKPLEPELKNVHKIYYATQGLLSSFAFDAFKIQDGRYLIDKYDLCPLTTTSQLVVDDTETCPKSVLMMGDIYYSPKQREQVACGDINSARGDESVGIDDFSERASKRYHFRYLPFTKVELDSLADIFAHTRQSVIRGTEATESMLRSQLTSKPDVLHLATHGFFIASDATALQVPFFKRFSSAVGNSMQRAGVALADAEDTWTGAKTPQETDDGILTANEVAQLDLSGIQLVALSACETALGNYSFEGVFGLPRGFKQAGVKSLLVSLWSVNDKSTSLLMTSFYRYWMQGDTKHEAFRRAVGDVRKNYPEPYFWAPFLLLDATK